MLDYTAQQCSGIASWYRDTDHIEKGFVYGGMPARNGVTARLVQLGFNGVDDIVSGRDNFLLAYSPQAKPEPLIEKLGERYEIAGTNLKQWTVGTPSPFTSQSMRLVDRVLDVDRAKDIRELRTLLQRTYRPSPPRLSEYPTSRLSR